MPRGGNQHSTCCPTRGRLAGEGLPPSGTSSPLKLCPQALLRAAHSKLPRGTFIPHHFGQVPQRGGPSPAWIQVWLPAGSGQGPEKKTSLIPFMGTAVPSGLLSRPSPPQILTGEDGEEKSTNLLVSKQQRRRKENLRQIGTLKAHAFSILILVLSAWKVSD